MKRSATLKWASFLILVAGLAGCHSIHIDATLVNRTGAPIQLLEVDYPSASFGTDKLAAGAEYHYRFQVQGTGPLTVEYTASDGHVAKVTGPTVAQNQEGQLEIDLLPGAKAEFHPRLTTHP